MRGALCARHFVACYTRLDAFCTHLDAFYTRRDASALQLQWRVGVQVEFPLTAWVVNPHCCVCSTFMACATRCLIFLRCPMRRRFVQSVSMHGCMWQTIRGAHKTWTRRWHQGCVMNGRTSVRLILKLDSTGLQVTRLGGTLVSLMHVTVQLQMNISGMYGS